MVNIENDYFNWLYEIVCKDRKIPKRLSYRKLLMYLHNVDFTYSIPMDRNRERDGFRMRDRYIDEVGCSNGLMDDILDKPCSVLEMMLALSIRCEETIMDNTEYGDRTSQWFWGMIGSMGLNSMTDTNFDRNYVKEVVEKFLDRDYEPNGKGGLFTIYNYERDLRDVEIWCQLNWYLNSIS